MTESEKLGDRGELDFKHPIEAAEAIKKRLDALLVAWKDESIPEISILDEDVSGLLDGIIERRITTGQSRLASQLGRMGYLLPADAQHRLSEIVGDCARFGISASGQDLTKPYRSRSHGNPLQK